MVNPGMNLVSLAYRFFSDLDIVIGEGFQEALVGSVIGFPALLQALGPCRRSS